MWTWKGEFKMGRRVEMGINKAQRESDDHHNIESRLECICVTHMEGKELQIVSAQGRNKYEDSGGYHRSDKVQACKIKKC